ncbi:4-(cytidine 5'-diphospho)-2-C-methyl-D-erythritol kinase [Frisingicoccus sp.]|uniref:4-(cytidine 5'-diphospho)-2-C-methyl-D-erythritol kinase n=1 Tax=Frisingicoccus sp. TaxID=1918627 RepID=UPI003AB4F6DF
MNTIQMKAYGKVNLGLDVLRRREDGYHEVRMIMQTVQLYDKITMEERHREGIELETNLPFLPVNENNIAYRAARMLMEEFHIPGGLNIKIEKHIPVAAGMAGGSTDGAAVLYGVNQIYQLGLTKRQLMERGVRLGADVPYCIMRGTVLSEGIGEILTPVASMPDCHILVAKPPISVSTKYVYEHLKLDSVKRRPDIDGMIEALEAGNLKGVADSMENVLETVTIPEHPEIEAIKDVMRSGGALNAMMSGSGPTVFGIFDDEEKGMWTRDILRNGTLAKQVYLVKPFNIRIHR